MQWSYTDTVFHVSEQHWGGVVLFSRAMNIFSQDVYKLKTWCTSFLVTSDLCYQSPTQLYSTRAQNNYWPKVGHPTTKQKPPAAVQRSPWICLLVFFM